MPAPSAGNNTAAPAPCDDPTSCVNANTAAYSPEARERAIQLEAHGKAVQDAADIEHTAARIGRAAVLQALRDPASAQFGDVWAYESKKGPMVVCGSVNARNRFGGFTGPKFFVVGAGYTSVQMQDTTPGLAGIFNKLCAGRTYVAR